MKNLAKTILVVALKTFLGVGIAILLCVPANAQESGSAPGSGNREAPANAQGLVTQRNLSLPMAKTIAEAALAACDRRKVGSQYADAYANALAL